MKITSKEIRDKLNTIWPDLEYIWLWDTTYWAPNPDAIDMARQKSNLHTMEFVDEFNDCDNFARQFSAECRRKRYFQWKAGNLPDEQRHQLAIGDIFGDQFRGIGKIHMANVAICNDDEVYIIDLTPSENRMWKVDPKNDNALFISM